MTCYYYNSTQTSKSSVSYEEEALYWYQYNTRGVWNTLAYEFTVKLEQVFRTSSSSLVEIPTKSARLFFDLKKMLFWSDKTKGNYVLRRVQVSKEKERKTTAMIECRLNGELHIKDQGYVVRFQSFHNPPKSKTKTKTKTKKNVIVDYVCDPNDPIFDPKKGIPSLGEVEFELKLRDNYITGDKGSDPSDFIAFRLKKVSLTILDGVIIYFSQTTLTGIV
ncbi:hypothetical protein RFI_07292, partial [Reticulomyxa filosa]